MPPLFHTLLPSEILDWITSPPQGIHALVSLWLFTAAEVFLCIRALGGEPHTRDLSCAPNGRTCLRSRPWHKDRNNYNFSGLGTLRKGNILKCSFCFLTGAAGSLRCESSTCEGQGCVLCTRERIGQSSAQRHNQDIPWGRHFLGFHGKVLGSAVRYHCAEGKWGGGGRNLCHIPPTSLVCIPQVGSVCSAGDRMRRHETTDSNSLCKVQRADLRTVSLNCQGCLVPPG